MTVVFLTPEQRKALKAKQPPAALDLSQPVAPAGPLLLSVMFGAANKAAFLSKKIADWDPAKHPKGAKGLFIDTPDKVQAKELKPNDVIVTKNGKPFKVEKPTAKGVKVNPLDPVTGEQKTGYTVLMHDVQVAKVESAQGVGSVHQVQDVPPGAYVKTKAGKKFQVSKHGKWTTVYPVDDAGKVNGKHTVLQPGVKVTIAPEDETGQVDKKLHDAVNSVLEQLGAIKAVDEPKTADGWPADPLDWPGLYISDEADSYAFIKGVDEEQGIFYVVPLVYSPNKGAYVEESSASYDETLKSLKTHYKPVGKSKPLTGAEQHQAKTIEKLQAKAVDAAQAWLVDHGHEVGDIWAVIQQFEDKLKQPKVKEWLSPAKTHDDHVFALGQALADAIDEATGLDGDQHNALATHIEEALQAPDDAAPVSEFAGPFETLTDIGPKPGQIWADVNGSQYQIMAVADDDKLDVQQMHVPPGGLSEPSTSPMANGFHSGVNPADLVTNLTPWIGAKGAGKPQDEIQGEVALKMAEAIAKHTGIDEIGDTQTLDQDVKAAMGMDQGAHDESQITAGSMPGDGNSFMIAFGNTATGEELYDMYSPPEWADFSKAMEAQYDQAVAEAKVTPPATPTTVAQAVQEQLPAKLPKVPKVYPAGVGKDTRVVIEALSPLAHHHEFKDADTFVVKRVDANGDTLDMLGSAGSISKARKLARDASADHEQIDEVLRAFDSSTIHNLGYKPGQLVILPNGRLYQVELVDRTPNQTYNGEEPATRLHLKKVWFDDDGNRVFDSQKPYVTNVGADRAIPVTVADDVVAKQLLANGPPKATNSFSWYASAMAPPSLYHQEGLKAHLFSAKQTQVLRKERPGKYNPYLHADWSPDALVGKQTNEALKVMSALGYREIKPRQKDVVRVVNANGKRVLLHRDGNKITSVSEVKAPTISVDGTPRQLYEQLKETLESGGDISPLDPRNSAIPEARTCHVRTHIFDLAMGHQNGVAAKIGKVKGQKVKTDAQYVQEIEAEGGVESLDAYMAKVSKPPYAVLNYRQASREQFPESEGVPEWDPEGAKYETNADLNAHEAAALAVILKRRGVAKLVGQQGDAVHEGDYVPGLKASDPLEGARKLGAEWKKAEQEGVGSSLIGQLPDETQAYVIEQLTKFKPLAAEHIKSRQAEWSARASNLRNSDLQDEIAKRRQAEGTVPEATKAGEWGLPTWEEIELKPQTPADIDQLVAAIGSTPTDVPAFYSGGMVRDSVLQHKADETWGQVDLEFDEKVVGLLTQQGAVQEKNRRSIDPGYAGSAKMYDGIQYTLADASISYEPSPDAVKAAIRRAFDEAGLGHQVDSMLKQAPEPESVGAVASAWHKSMEHQGFTVTQAEGLAFADADDIVKNPGLGVTLDDVTVTILSAVLNDKIGVHSEKQTEATALKLKTAMNADVKDKPEAATEVENLVQAWIKMNWGDTPSEGTVNQSRSQVYQALEQFAKMKSGGEKRIEYVPHDQAAWNAGGAPTNQRGRLTLVGYSPSEAATKLKELGIVGDLEDEVPFGTILRSPRRHGRLVPLLPEYLRGEAELPKAPGRITHGLTANNHDALENMKRILDSGGLLSIHERHRVGIKVTTASPAGDIRSGIDHAVFTTVGSGGAVGSGASISVVMKPDAFLRRDITLAPHDFGGADTRYPQYKSYLNKLQGEVGEPKTNLYAPVSPKVRQRHLGQISTGDSNEYNLGPTVPIEDWDQIVVSNSSQQAAIEQQLSALLAQGKIAEKPEVVIGAGYGNVGKANEPLGMEPYHPPF